MLKNAFTLRSLLLIGALLQCLLTFVLPRYALLPPLLLLLHTITSTMHSTLTLPSRQPPTLPLPYSPYTPLSMRSSPVLPPSPPATPANLPPGLPATGLVTLHLCVRFSHPLGLLSPGARDIGAHFSACNDRLLAAASPFHCLGYSSWTGTTHAANNTLLSVYYFRSAADLHAFAHDATHRKAWEWYSQFQQGKGGATIGVYHETFATGEGGGWEAIGLNMEPTLLGAARGRGEGGEWMSALVDARRDARLKGMVTRMGAVKE